MKVVALNGLVLFLLGCSPTADSLQATQISAAQAQSEMGPTSEWQLEQGIARRKFQQMRDRAYRFCLERHPSDSECFLAQDRSLHAVSQTVGLWRSFLEERNTEFPYALGHQLQPKAFTKIRAHCWSIYADHGHRDARMLGPCLMNGVGGDFFGIVPVP